MNVLFEYPLAFAAFASLPILAAIYLLRNRFRRVFVSSLMLWVDQRGHKQGGLNWDRLQTPLLFLLELLILLLLSLAATGPLLRAKTEVRRLVIVLDDSFSMLAGTDRTARQDAVAELKRYLKASEPFRATFLLAGPRPTLLAHESGSLGEVSSVLDGWRCLSPNADMNKALAMASELADQKARILVISDRSYDGLGQDGRWEWWSFGRPLNNAGFIAAERTAVDGRDRCMLTVGNFSDQARTLTLTIASADGAVTVYHKSITVAPSEPFQMIFEAPPEMDLAAFISDDALSIDNRVYLLRPETRQVRVAVDIRSAVLSEAVIKALDVIPLARQVTDSPDLLITDTALINSADSPLWTLHIESDPNAAAFVGPFIVDRSHPLSEGLNLDGVIWSAGRRQSRLVPIISAGNVTLLEEEQRPPRGRRLRLYLNPEVSTLQQSANWPIFFWNLTHWRQKSLEGLGRSNYRLGEQVVFEPPPNCSQVLRVRPDGSRQIFECRASAVVFEADLPGRHQLITDTGRYDFAVNAISPNQSDLRLCQTRIRAHPDQASQFWWEYRSREGALLLAAVIIMLLYRYIVFLQSKGAI